MNQTYAVIDSTGLVKRIISWDGAETYVPENGCAVILANGAGAGWMYNADGTFTPPPEPAPVPPTAAEQAAAAMSAGIKLTSTETPELNGTYGLDQIAQNNVTATVTYILLNGTFPGNTATMPWVDAAGAAHVWPSITEFKWFATAFANFIASVSLYAASNGAAGAIPSNEVTIP